MKTRPRAWVYGVCLLVGLLGLGSGASAKTPADAASCDADPQCNRLANQALDDSHAGRFAEAQRAYRAAYAARPDPLLLFNLARVLHKSGQLAEAVSYYQQYLDAGAEGSAVRRRTAQQRMAEARREQSAAEAAAVPAPAPIVLALPPAAVTPAEPSRRVPVYRKWWLWTVVGVAAAGVAIGIGVGLAARRPDLSVYEPVYPSGS